ncbi:MAG TPA: HAMP domain-containing sensor histidine kinase, partial [Candidatus Gracilibacteria bacterium]|nr:HAMP domain-containing sensor histidine kinase [Candidatus Gracilibacteria bacterium]
MSESGKKINDPGSDEIVVIPQGRKSPAPRGPDSGIFARLAAPDQYLQMVLQAVHNLRGPLSSVSLNIAAVRDRIDRDSVEALDDALESVRRVDAIITQTLTLSMAASGNVILAPHETSVSDLVLSMVSTWPRSQIVGIGEAFDLNVVAEVDSNHFLQLLENLIANAVKYGKIALVSMTKNEQDFSLSVHDKGPGVGDNPESLFQMFKRGAQRHGKKGFGIGLAYCKTIAEAHGGTIAV